jgi:hypothetical protein
MTENNSTPSPLNVRKGHAQQVFRTKQAADALNLRSVRTAPVLAYTSETPKKESSND